VQYLPLFLLLVAVLIAAWFYLQRAKTRGTATTDADVRTDPSATDAP